MAGAGLAAGAVVAAAAFALLLRRVATSPDGGLALDHVVRRRFEPAFHPGGRAASQVISVPGFPGVYMPAAAAGAWLAWKGGRADLAAALVLPAAALVAWAAQRVTKRAFRRTRPPTPVARGKTEPAFPSGHTTGVTSVAVAGAWLAAHAGLASPARAAALASLAILLVGLSRIYLDEHWATDVLGGLSLGAAVALAAAALGGG